MDEFKVEYIEAS